MIKSRTSTWLLAASHAVAVSYCNPIGRSVVNHRRVNGPTAQNLVSLEAAIAAFSNNLMCYIDGRIVFQRETHHRVAPISMITGSTKPRYSVVAVESMNKLK